MIHLRSVTKSYRRGAESVLACAVDRLDVESGEQVALVGR
ncbi:MAG: ABC transporter ATP-binding protein, partial [Planctomycetes bacterium]|nr:ABC transporter ATP-binding protein [Planctomycetota bacterium]